MFYTNKSVRFIFLTIIALSLIFSLGRPQIVSAQSKNKVEHQIHSTNYALLGSPGSLDPTFDGDGRVTTTFGADSNVGRAIAIQPDGKIVVAGHQHNSNSFRDFALARYNTDGSLDASFGTNGKMITGFEFAYALDIVIQTDGKIVAAGYGYNDGFVPSFFLARYNSNGTLDTSFDTDGKVITGIGEAYALAIQSDGKLLVTGSRATEVSLDSEIVLARYNTNGSLDTTFDSDGYLTTNPGSYTDEGRSIIIQPDGKILVGGSSYPNDSYPDYALIRYNADGSLDTSFSGDGITTTDLSNNPDNNPDYEAGIALQPDGKIILAGSSYGLGPYLSAVLIRYNSNGSLDSTFDGDGKVSTSFANETQINDVALQSNGKIVVAGVNSPNNVNDFSNDFFLVRYNADGSLDTGFDTDGKVTTDFSSSKDVGHSIAIQSDGNIVVAGSRSIDSTNSDFAVARYIGDQVGPSAVVDVNIAGSPVGNDINIPLHSGARKSFAGVDAGPVQVVSTNGLDIIAAERVIYTVNGVDTSFTEMMALPNSQLDNTYWLPWYNNVDLNTQLRFANVSGAEATVHVYIGGTEMVGSPFTLAAGASTRKSFVGIDKGPVKIESNVNIVAAERVIYNVNGVDTSFSEMMALPNSQLDNTYWLPWYNNVDLNTQLRFANVSGAEATVHVTIGGVEMIGSPFILAPGASTRKSFVGIDKGPVKIESNVDIVAAERVIYKVNGVDTSFSETMGLPNSQLDTTYWLPWYNNVDLNTQLRFANVSGAQATVHVTIGGTEMVGSPFILAPGASTRKSFVGIDKGPVKIESNVDIVAAERVIYTVNNVATSFSEMMALPNSQLDIIYWLPWYNNIDLNTQLRFAVP